MWPEDGHAEVVSLLLGKEGVDVNQVNDDGATPLYIASWEGHAEVVSLLLGKEGVDVNQATMMVTRHFPLSYFVAA